MSQTNALKVNEQFMPLPQEKVEELRSMSLQHQVITTPDGRTLAEAFLKEGKKIARIASENRLAFTRKLDEIKKEAMAPEKEIEAILAPVESAITAQLRKEHAEAEEKRKKAEAAAAAERKRQQDILDAETRTRTRIATFVSDTTRQISMAPDNLTLELIAKQVRTAKFEAEPLVSNPAPFQEKFQEERAVLLDLIKRAKKDESVKEVAATKATEADAALDTIQEQAQEKELEITMNADLQKQAMDQQIGTVSGARTIWTYDILDKTSIPQEFLMVNDAAIKNAIKEGVRDIPGLKIYSTVGRSGR